MKNNFKKFTGLMEKSDSTVLRFSQTGKGDLTEDFHPFLYPEDGLSSPSSGVWWSIQI